MEQMLTERKEAVLKIVIDEYIRTGTPVPSVDIAGVQPLQVSSATIRNELAWLKQEGFLTQPHTSAGSMPSDQGYRYYVNFLLEESDILADEQRLVRHMFHQVETDLEEWIEIAAILLAQMAHNAAFVVPPKTARARLQRLHLIAVQELLALLVMVLQDGRLRRHLIAFEQAMSQDELDRVSNKLNAMYGGMTRPQIATRPTELTAPEAKVAGVVAGLMTAEDERGYQEPHIEGLRNLLGQPEFSHGAGVLEIVELLEKRPLFKPVLARELDRGLLVIIGEENPEEGLHDLSIVISRYGKPDELTGVVGVFGPRRMPYSRSIASVRFLASLLGQLAAKLPGTSTYSNTQ